MIEFFWKLQEADYAMVASNISNKPIPVETVKAWLFEIRKAAQQYVQRTVCLWLGGTFFVGFVVGVIVAHL